ncbi:hypothetical protein M378DRAFT_17979 [Amanita muscaria Koide BX008]|uniref:Uncharacterized protein n=1 Tax=Amanita muscaria (strain Koide BX008) TaxID=946122 RepID=A0A0C2RYI8_AMAMK|nr:hypothetical protein M378DRAFT_17979 [Amanita muscaria Koide BX008]
MHDDPRRFQIHLAELRIKHKADTLLMNSGNGAIVMADKSESSEKLKPARSQASQPIPRQNSTQLLPLLDYMSGIFTSQAPRFRDAHKHLNLEQYKVLSCGGEIQEMPKRSAGFDKAFDEVVKRKLLRNKDDDDQLDLEYRYWSFVEVHPSHDKVDVAIQTQDFTSSSMAPATFRPNKPLPKDSPQLHYQRPFLWILLEFTISCLCLGIPYFSIDWS